MTRGTILAATVAATAMLAASSAQAQTASDLIAKIARELDGRSVDIAHSNGLETTQEIRVLGETVTRTNSYRGSVNFVETVEFNLLDIRKAVWGTDAEGTHRFQVYCRQSAECISRRKLLHQNRYEFNEKEGVLFFHVYGQNSARRARLTRHFENINEERVASLINQLAALHTQDRTGTVQQRPRDPARVTAANAERTLSLTRAQRTEVQKRLNALGHDAGPADGIFGPRTRRAIKALQRAMGLEDNGFLNGDLLNQLASVQQETQSAQTLPQSRTCFAQRTLGKKGSEDDYDVEVEFTNNCAYAINVRWRYLYGLKHSYERGEPIKCSSGAAQVLEPGESDVVGMGPLARGFTQKWHICTQYEDADIQERTGYLDCYRSNRPSCPPIP